MKNSKIRYCIKLCILFSILGCSQNTPHGNIVDISEPMQLNPINASVLIENCRYIPLETSDESIIGEISTIVPCQDGFFVMDRFLQISYFDINGKFMRRIARKGQGPGEYTSIHAIDVSEYDKTIHLFDGNSRRILVYTFNNEFLRAIKINIGVTKIMKTSWGYIAYANPVLNSGQETAVITTLAEDGEELNVLQYKKVEHSSPWVISPILKNFNEKYYYYPPLQDTLYSVQVDKIVPEYIFPKGKYSIAMEEMETMEKYRAAYARGMTLNDLTMDSRQLIMYCTRKNERELYLYDFASKKLSGISEIVNDIDSSFSFRPRIIYNNQWIEVKNAHEVLEESEILPTALNNLGKYDNSVIRISTLKKQ